MKIEIAAKQTAREVQALKEQQAKNRDKKRKHEGRFDMPKTFLAKKEVDKEDSLPDQDELDDLRYFN